MAMIRPSSIVAAISGPIGGQTFVNAKTGIIVRPRTYRRPNHSAALLSQQSIFANTVRRWRTLTDLQKSAWQSLAQNFPRTNRIGQASPATAFQTFAQTNMLSRSFLGPDLDDPPTETNPQTPILTDAIATDLPLYLAIALRNSAPAETVIQLTANRSLSTSLPKFRTPFPIVATQTLTEPIKNFIIFTDKWIQAFGELSPGETFTVRARFYLPGSQLLPTPAQEISNFLPLP